MEVRKVEFDATFRPGEIEFLDKKLRQSGDLHAIGSAELMGATEEIRVRGKVKGTMEADCDRCLELARFDLDESFDLFYRPSATQPEKDELAIDAGESEIGFYEGSGLDLKDILREQILLMLPMQRVCRESCKGMCPSCGQNRNVRECGCENKPVDDRWAALRNLK